MSHETDLEMCIEIVNFTLVMVDAVLKLAIAESFSNLIT